ncbi:MAG: flagellar hook-associated protein FlgK [Planctomyces sp.]|nr:flagellar hook-associated protein FlgK [Planctomyces sp.]
MNMFAIPLSALRAAQHGMNTVSSNLANATTPGYHAQRLQLAEGAPVIDGNLRVGAGVVIQGVDRMRSAWIEQSLLRNNSASGEAAARLEAALQLDTLFNPTDNSLHARTQQFFEAWQDLASRPADSTVRQDLLATADALVSEINQLSDRLTELARDFEVQINDTVNTINRLAVDIAALNREISVGTATGNTMHDLADRRDQLVSQLSELIDVRSLEWSNQPNTFSAANGAMTISTRAPVLSVASTATGYQLLIDGWASPLPAGGGRLAGLLEAGDAIIGETQSELAQWSAQLIRAVDQVHGQGVGLDGPFTVLTGERGLSSVSIPMSEASRDFPVDAGLLTITVTHLETGERTVHAVSLEPGLDSLDAFMARIDALPNISAQVSELSGKLTIIAHQGYAFDFTGQTATHPDMSAWSGTSDVTIGGTYTGTVNDQWSVRMLGDGTVGLTPGLQAELRDGAGNVLGVWNVGAGYVAGDELTTSSGITLKFGSGSVVSGETAGFRVTGNSDTTGVLSALGMNSLFTGKQAGDFAVRRDLLQNGRLVAAARSDQDGDNLNAKAAARIATMSNFTRSGMTFGEYLAQMTSDSGALVRSTQSAVDQLGQIHWDLTTQRDGVSGVDPNEEMVRLLEYQRLFQTSSRFISTLNKVLDDLFTLI